MFLNFQGIDAFTQLCSAALACDQLDDVCSLLGMSLWMEIPYTRLGWPVLVESKASIIFRTPHTLQFNNHPPIKLFFVQTSSPSRFIICTLHRSLFSLPNIGVNSPSMQFCSPTICRKRFLHYQECCIIRLLFNSTVRKFITSSDMAVNDYVSRGGLAADTPGLPVVKSLLFASIVYVTGWVLRAFLMYM